MRKLVDELCAVDGRRFVDVERLDDAPAGIAVQNLLNQAGLAFVTELGQNVGQYIARVIAAQTVLIVAEAAADEQGPNLVLEREAVGEFSLHERAGREHAADRNRGAIVHLVTTARPVDVLPQIPSER